MILLCYKVSRFFFSRRLVLISKLIDKSTMYLFRSSLPGSVKLGRGTKLAYGGIGFVIHHRAVIGENCMIGQGITIGGRSRLSEVPVIGNDVYIGAGSRVLGPVTIGNGCIIGPNAVVLKDVPDNCIVAGVPARIIRTNINIKDYV